MRGLQPVVCVVTTRAQAIPLPTHFFKKQTDIVWKFRTIELARHEVSAQETGRLLPTVLGRTSMHRMVPAEQTGQMRKERPVKAS